MSSNQSLDNPLCGQLVIASAVMVIRSSRWIVLDEELHTCNDDAIGLIKMGLFKLKPNLSGLAKYKLVVWHLNLIRYTSFEFYC